MLLYVASILPPEPGKELKRRLRTEIIAALALWDPVLADHLVSANLEDLLSPARLLSEFVLQEGWQIHPSGVCDWQAGFTNSFEGQDRLHSAVLSVKAMEDEIAHRVWSAEVAVLLPFVEEQRQILIRQLSCFLQVPFTTRFGDTIDDVRDLEIGHIEGQLATCRQPISRAVRRSVELLRAIRNCLSHQEVVPPSILCELIS
jgi:hypothetical protein